MEHLSPEERELAFIRTKDGPVQASEIERIYRDITAVGGRPTAG